MGEPLTVDELIASVRNSTLPIVLVEGSDDLTAWRHVEQLLDPTQASLLPCGGRKALLDVYSRRGEFSEARVAFVADQDCWLFSAIPPEYSGVIFTEGYSIENDAYSKSLEQLLTADEAQAHALLLDAVCAWFAFAIYEHLGGATMVLSHHPGEICKDVAAGIDPGFSQRIGYRPAPSAFASEIRANYRVKLRGKQLLSCLVRLLSAPERPAKYSKSALMEMGFKLFTPPPIQKLIGALSRTLELQSAE